MSLRAGVRARALRVIAAFLAGLVVQVTCGAATAVPAADDPAVEARMQRITAELRCLVCQNQTIADSHASLADDLRREVRELIRKGASDEEIKAYMTERYGDFVLYRPPLKTTTMLLWGGPALILFAGATALAVSLRRRSRRPAEDFDDDEGLDSKTMHELS